MVSRLGFQPCAGLASAWQGSLVLCAQLGCVRLGCVGLECIWLGLAGLGARLGWAPISCARLCSVGFGSAGALFVFGLGWARFCMFSMSSYHFLQFVRKNHSAGAGLASVVFYDFLPFFTVRTKKSFETFDFLGFFNFLKKIVHFLARHRRRQKMVKISENQCIC